MNCKFFIVSPNQNNYYEEDTHPDLFASTSCLYFLQFFFRTKIIEEKAEPQKAESKKTSSKIRNGIELNTTGNLKVSQAFLLFEDGTLVPESNEAKVNQPVNLRLIIEDGFTENNGKVEIGASEKIRDQYRRSALR